MYFIWQKMDELGFQTNGADKSNKDKFLVAINPDQPEAGKHVVLIHELLHVIEKLLIRNKIIKRRVDHEFITNAPAALLHILTYLGFYKGISFKQLTRFMKKYGK